MAAKPIPPGDEDLEHFTIDALRSEVVSLTVYLRNADEWRIRRSRAMRLLRQNQVPRNDVAALASMTPGAVKNAIDDLNRSEAAYAEGQPCGRCDHPSGWHHGKREHPKQLDHGCVPPEGSGLSACYCVELQEEM